MIKTKTRMVWFFLLASLFWVSNSFAFSFHKPLSQRPQVAKFIDAMVVKHHFDKEALITLFNQVHISEPVISKIKAPLEMQPWVLYKNLFITPQRIALGVEFWNKNKNALQRAQHQFGVPPEIIIAILGIETKYGTHQGEHRVIDALTTLAFTRLPRADYFRSELEEFLLLCQEQKLNPLSVYGSYAGAIGQSQFMPSSYRYYAVDFAGDGKKDLRHNEADAIGSIGNYLSKHGWSPKDTIVATQAEVSGANYKRFMERSYKPTFAISELGQNGIKPKIKMNKSTLVSIVLLEDKKSPEFWLGLHNFYVITRYNSSKLYAMAVVNLSHEIKSKYASE